jgi:hypothetical protein
MPQFANFLLSTVKDVFSRHDIYVIEDFGDGQIMWGNEPISNPYNGAFHMADCFAPDRYDIFTVRAILSKLDKAGKAPVIEQELYDSINEEFD